ncbi:MAG: 5-(carboxyamino)imidazole ribonucleotide synthase [Streptosporangiales bacterium]|nr:5-(carboxyamino)imidazole ribonucleotide synthase [Streptosporangiales bacterium]
MPVVGMVGGGQLARMTHQAAIALGVGFRVMATSSTDSAARVCGDVRLGDHRSFDDLRAFGKGPDVLTFDHEHVPTEHLRTLEAEGLTVRPSSGALLHAQDKRVMRDRLAALGMPIPRERAVDSLADVAGLAEQTGWPVVLKSVRGGYDGRGVWPVESPEAARELLERLADVQLMAEEYVDFRRELAVLVARSPHGQAAAYPAVQTVQVDGICREVLAPAPGLDDESAVAAQRLALSVADALGVVGLLAVEMFQTDAGVLINELAMRPHNCGHWTIEGARTSQFEQHLRAVLDLPLGSPGATAPHVVMANVLGGAVEDAASVYARYTHVMAHDPAIRVHFYGKDVRPGRKIGHVTALGNDLDEVRGRAREAAAYLRGEEGR